MKVPKRINKLRMRLMHGLTKNIGSSLTQTVLAEGEKLNIKRVLISRPNHRLGNQLLLTPLVQEVINLFPDCKIDLFVKGGVAHVVFENYKNVKKIIQLPKKPFNQLSAYLRVWVDLKKGKYDLVINGDRKSSSGRLSTQLVNAKFKIFGEIDETIQNEYDDYEHISKYPIYNLRNYLTKIGFSKNNKPIPTLNIKLSNEELQSGKSILRKIVNNDKPSICIYTNATGDKVYDEIWWIELYKSLLENYPNYNVIELLPIENISKINFTAPNLYSKDIREMCALIANAAIFIAADNGVMHLASAAQIPVVGFFKVTKINTYRPYGNGSLAFDTNNTNLKDWLKGFSDILGS